MNAHLNPHHNYSFSSRSVICVLISVLSGCVSVQLSGGKSQKANNVTFQKPTDNFKSIEAENTDQAWQSTKTGNTLAFLSECQPAIEANLKTLESESLSALANSHVVKSEAKLFNGRESSFSLVEGLVDGIPVSVALLLFKKNNCNFTITFSGRKSVFDSEFHVFESFRESFKVP